MKKLLLFIGLLCSTLLPAQMWVDSLYTTQTTTVTYGSAVNYAGITVPLEMDITLPLNDSPPPCGRPLMVCIHGGGFVAGTKNDADVQYFMRRYAERGYAAVSINYRLGQFNTNIALNCNLPNWNCLNMADTAEWHRAYYRGIQDARGAIRYLVNNKTQFNVNHNNVFVMGTSAGGFIAMGVGYLDVDAEKPLSANAQVAVAAPNAAYEQTCIVQPGFAPSISTMDLSRPNLGGINGTLNPSTTPYTIRGVGNFFGAVFSNLFLQSATPTQPPLYLFHQPNDLIVPYGTDPVLEGFSDCAVQTNCVPMISRPIVHGSQSIVNTLNLIGNTPPPYLFENTNNTADCLTQTLNPSTQGHSIDSYILRDRNMATFFALYIDSLSPCNVGIIPNYFSGDFNIYPNPANSSVNVKYTLPNPQDEGKVTLVNALGQIIVTQNITAPNGDVQLNLLTLPNGVYTVLLSSNQTVVEAQKLIVTK